MDVPGLGVLDMHSDRPVYKQIADHMRAAIETGKLAPGDLLPSEAELMAHYDVARMTARQATALLQREGVAEARHGRGLFVRQRAPALPADVRELLTDLADSGAVLVTGQPYCSPSMTTRTAASSCHPR
jgi:DNA-binding GntR family transcriptional regulator